MANEKNLKPFNKLTVKEQREIAKKGGLASVQKRRKQKTYREMAKTMLSATITDKTMLKELKAFGINETDIKTYTLLGMIKASANGNPNAFDRLMEITGEKEKDSNKDVISKLDKVIGDIDAIANE